MKRMAINGLGRIGRASLKVILATEGLELVGVNDLMSIENAVYLLKYDSIYGKYGKFISHKGDTIYIGDKFFRYTSLKDIADLPWKELKADVVIESTGLFTSKVKQMVKNIWLQERNS